ncbi:MAG: sel1 repeat family protein [Clostridia bacterium]|nr:sel1 repeat family protein [Clostridia bacterium]
MALFKKQQTKQKTISFADYQIIQRLQEKGDGMSGKDAYEIALCYSRNEYDIEDEKRTLLWLLKAYQMGCSSALQDIEIYAKKGRISAMKVIAEERSDRLLPKDADRMWKKIFTYYRQAFDKKASDLEACITLADCYFYGRGTKQDYSEARSLYHHAADLGDEKSRIKVGEIYEFGYCGDKNYRVAFDCYEKAFSKEPKAAEEAMERLSQTPDINIKGLLGQFYFEKLKKYDQAIALFEVAYQKCYSKSSAKFLADMYCARNQEADIEKAIGLYEKAALNDCYEDAAMALGKLYEEGILVPKDLKKAVDWYEASTKKASKKFVLPPFFLFPYWGVEYISRLANQNVAYAQRKMGDIYDRGYLLEQDYEKAINYYTRASQNGDTEATTLLEKCREKLRQKQKLEQEKVIKEFERGVEELKILLENMESNKPKEDFSLPDFGKITSFENTVLPDSSAPSSMVNDVSYTESAPSCSYPDITLDIASGIYNPYDATTSDSPYDYYIDVSDM